LIERNPGLIHAHVPEERKNSFKNYFRRRFSARTTFREEASHSPATVFGEPDCTAAIRFEAEIGRSGNSISPVQTPRPNAAMGI
jgi:hypothetical protein